MTEVFRPGDPKPVFMGDWNSASGREKGEHSERVRQWRKAQGYEPPARMAPGSDQRATHADDLAALQRLIDSPQSLPSDVTRAIEAKQRILHRQEESQREELHGPLLALHAVVVEVPSTERAELLRSLLTLRPPTPAELPS